MSRLTVVTAVASAAIVCMPASAEPQFIRSAAELGDPRGYCLDVLGFRNPEFDKPLRTHSCKYDLPGFDIDMLIEQTDAGHLRMVSFDRCFNPDALEAGAHINMDECEAGENHAWTLREDGGLSPDAAPELCVTLSSETELANTSIATVPEYTMRTLTLEECADDIGEYQEWRWSAPDEGATINYNTLRASIPAAVQDGNREIGQAIDRDATVALYADMERLFGPDDVNVTRASYGPNEAHALEVYTGVNRKFPMPLPVVLLVHGGGYVRGDLTSLSPMATHLAGLGYVVVNMTYPLAPDHTWPAGAQAVGAAVDWVRANISEYNGNPEHIVAFGHSAGAVHVATYALNPEALGAEHGTVRGAILASPGLHVEAASPEDPANSYYGEEDLDAKRLLDNITRTSIPLMILTAEHDPAVFHSAAAELHHRLVNEHDAASPRVHQIPGHGHISYVHAVGTGDRMLDMEVMDFITATTPPRRRPQ